MEYFWKQQDDIPEGMGYPLFGVAHLLSVGITLMLVFLFVLWFRKMDDRKQRKVLKVIPIVMLMLEVFKDIFLVSVNRFGLTYLPLHICSIGIFVFFFREYLPWEKTKEFLGDVAFVIILPSALVALFDADWTYVYPVWNFINLHSYVWHGMLVLYPVLIKMREDISPSIKHIYRPIIFLLIVVTPIYFFDKHFGLNFCFVNWPIENSPLEWMAARMGNPGYLIGYGAITFAVILLMYFCVWMGRGKGDISKEE